MEMSRFSTLSGSLRRLCSSRGVGKSLKSRNSGGTLRLVAGEPANFHIIFERDFMGGIPTGISNWRNFGNSERELVIIIGTRSILMREVYNCAT